jgi:benzylsuccinate CoA-transferase BbsE subunit
MSATTAESPATTGWVGSGPASPTALAGIRVLDLTGETAAYCGKLLADMGADVILVEPPNGNALRAVPPFIGGEAGPERGLTHLYYNTSKRGITLDLDRPDGQALFRRLAATADLVIEAERPGTMAARGLDYAALASLNPALVLTSVTPFGQTGPYSLFEGEDLVALALGGFLLISGYPDAAPTRIHGNQAFLTAATYAAVGSMLAILDAEATGQGQHVDVSIQESVTMALENTAQFYDLEGKVRRRSGLTQRYTGAGLFPSNDGYVYVFVGGLAAGRFWDALVDWLEESGAEGAARLRGERWQERAFREGDEARRIFGEVFAPFAAARGRMELYYDAQRRRIPLSPVATAADVAENRQLRHRGFMVPVAHPETGRIIEMPGAPVVLSATPWRIQRPAPRVGEHNGEIYGDLGIDGGALAALHQAGTV